MAVDIARWLRQLGLDQYAPAFADNDIDGSLLAELAAEDLVSLGVKSVGHRRRLLSAIAALPATSLRVSPKPCRRLRPNPSGGSSR
jgi:hypothetical protein